MANSMGFNVTVLFKTSISNCR